VFVFQRGTLARMLGTAIAIAVSGSTGLQAQRLPLQIYDAASGLAHNRVRCLLADSRGFLWFGTVDGLSRFDGSRFTNYGVEQGLPHPEVEEIVEAGPGVYWVATPGGLARLRSDPAPSRQVDTAPQNAVNSRVQGPPTVALTTHSLGADPAANDVITMTKDRAGRIWIATAAGLFVLEQPLGEPSFRRVEPDLADSSSQFRQVQALAEGPDRALWIGTSSGLFRRLPDGRVSREYTVPAGDVRRLLVDRLGRVWVGHDYGLSLVVPTASASPRTPSTATPLRPCRAAPRDISLPKSPGEACRFETLVQSPDVVRSLSEGADGRVWIGTNGGLIEFDGEVFRAYSERHGLPHATINAVAEDRAGGVWIGTDAGGVAKLTRNGFVSFSEQDGLRHDYVTSISQGPSGRLRAGGGWPRLNEFDGERFTSGRFSIPGPVDSARAYDVLEDHSGNFWVGTPDGLLRFPGIDSVAQLARTRPTAVYSTADGLPVGRVTPAFEDSRGDVWMSAHLGNDRRVVRWQRSTGRFQQYPETDAPVVPLRGPVFAEDGAGTVWLGSARGLTRHREGRFTGIGIGIGGEGRNLRVTALHVDPRGRLWIGTQGTGLYRSDDPRSERPRFTAYTVATGLSSGTVWCLTDDGAGKLYVGTARGIDRLEPESGRFKHFSVADGLAGSEVIAAFLDRAGALWFGTFKGISRLIAPPDVARGPPTVWIGGLRIRGQAQPLETLGQSQVSMRNLASHQNEVQIDFFGLSAAAGEHLTYQYQLEGTGSAWTAPTTDRTVNYAELAPGSYRFLVRAVNEDGQISQVPASVTFTILPPVWMRGWFLGTLAGFVIAAGYALHKSRVTRLLETERLRTRIASDLHDDVGSSLTQISILSEMARTQVANLGAGIADPLSRIGILSRESVDSMSDIVWAIDPVRDTPVHLLQRMRRLAYELLGNGGVQLDFTASGDASPRLTADVRRQVFLMFKETLNNIVRHAGATVVRIEVTVAPRQLRFVVIDDGRGFDPSRTGEGQGLRSLERRATSLGGMLQVTSSPGSGTRVMFSVPVH
jgi:ligand-binding sensor domain-containing protein/signal transduction histidine kinase